MNFKSRRVALAVAQVLGVGGALMVVGTPAHAQDIRVTVTGTSIKRVEAEGALPVITLDRKFIEESGFTNATELIQSLPAMQNFVATTNSINGGGGGNATAALHALPSKYTLVLINGQRTPGLGINNAQGGGEGVNIESIPLDAVEKVEILTDGASAIYGSDAIAGVVNFILKKTETAGNAYFQGNSPQEPGGGSWSAGVSKGWGDLDKDKWNVMFTYSHTQQNQLQAIDRDVSAKGAFFPFTWNGVKYWYNGATSNTEPANITFSAYPKGGDPATATPYAINPYYAQNRNCGSQFASPLLDPTGTGFLGAKGVSCRFDYAKFVQDLPDVKRDAGVINGTWRVNADTTLWGNLNLSRTEVNSQYAPPAQPLGINPTTRYPTLYNNYVVPFLNANNLDIKQPSNPTSSWANVGYRAVSQGGRADEYRTDWWHAAFGVDGKAWGWDYNAKIISAQTKLTDTWAGGFTDSTGFQAAIAAGQYDPVLPQPGTAQNIQKFILVGEVNSVTKSSLTTLQAGAQHDLWQLGGGMSIIAVGASYNWNKYTIDYGPYALVNSGYSTQGDLTATAIGGPGGSVPIDASRNNYGIYAELFAPVLKSVEVTGSVRYDHYSKVESGYVFSTTPDADGVYQQIADADLGNTFSKTTYKVTGRWTPVQGVLVRGSYGTGFKAPSLGDMAGPLVFNGSTSGSYPCPFPGTAGCLPGSAQYDLLAGPNGLSGAQGLKPEKSTQWTVGGRWDDAIVKGLSVGADLWNVKIDDQVLSGGINEQVGFANPQQYASLFVNPYIDPVGGQTTIAFSQLPFNGGKAEYEGVDWDVSYRTPTSWGLFSAQWTGTYMIKAEYNFGPGQPMLTSLGVYGPDNAVVARTTMQLQLALQSGGWTNVVTGHYRSGYQDATYPAGTNIFLANPDGSLGESVDFAGLEVPSYTTWDYQGAYLFDKFFKLTWGINNMFDRKPPLTLQSAGAGNAVGYDGRYANPIGREFYIRLGFKF